MKIALLISSISCQWPSNGHGMQRPLSRQRPSVPSFEDLVREKQRQLKSAHQGLLCGADKTFRLKDAPRKTMILESPFYPAIINQQIQCQWVLHGIPGRRIKLEFIEFYMSKGEVNGDESCNTSYLSISDYMSDGTSKGDHGTFRLCGNNPGVFISRNADLKIDLHNDKGEAPMKKPQRFKIRMSITDEPSNKILGGEFVVKHDFNTRPNNGRTTSRPRSFGAQQSMANFPGIKLKSAMNARQPNGHHIGTQYRHRNQLPQVLQQIPTLSTSIAEEERLIGSKIEDEDSNVAIIVSLAVFGVLLGVIAAVVLVRFNFYKKEESTEKSEESTESN